MRRPLPDRTPNVVADEADLLDLLVRGLAGEQSALHDALNTVAAKPQVAGEVSAAPDHPLVQVLRTKMPFGRFVGRPLIELPEEYLVWFAGEGFPKGKLGRQLALVYEIKQNGLEPLLAPLLYPRRSV